MTTLPGPAFATAAAEAAFKDGFAGSERVAPIAVANACADGLSKLGLRLRLRPPGVPGTGMGEISVVPAPISCEVLAVFAVALDPLMVDRRRCRSVYISSEVAAVVSGNPEILLDEFATEIGGAPK